MILSFGQLYDSSCQDDILDVLESRINEVRTGPDLKREVVISALDKISRKIGAGDFDQLIKQIDIDNAQMHKEHASMMLGRESLEYRLKTELGDEPVTNDIVSRRVPLGTILHISAGNADVLPAYSLMEGLICGNINILKLPESDEGLTIYLLKMLTDIEPELAGYIHVFDTPSSDINAMLKMSRMADAISVTGGDAAISAIRQMAPMGIKIIEWGHKLSFCYISTDNIEAHKDDLKTLAEHIISTRQLLCSSCQVIYIDTEEMDEIRTFCEFFLPILEKAAEKQRISEIGAIAEDTLRKKCEEIEHILETEISDRKRYSGKGCSLMACEDHELELSEMWGNVLVKRLPAENLITVLRQKKGYLQTAGLIADENRKKITALLIRSGINRVLPPGMMSSYFHGGSHDGMYPFEMFTRIVNYNSD